MASEAERRPSLGARFAHAVEHHAEAIATSEDGRTCTYGEAADHVQAFTDLFRQRSAGAAPVAVLAHGHTAAWQAILGAAVAGIPWVPIDPRQPSSVVRQMLRSSGTRLCVGFTADGKARRKAGFLFVPDSSKS